MKKVFVSQHLFEVEMRKEWLEQAGIPCLIKNQRSSGLAGEIPFTEVFPELWVIQDERYDRARRLLDDGLVLSPSSQDGWICPGCEEHHESQFATCWKCGQERLFA
jgi:Putative prokaryotic signal transducing protein